MGKGFSGSTSQGKPVSMLTGEQNTLLQQLVTGLGPQFMQSMSGMMTPKSPEEREAEFEKMYGAPAKQAFEQKITPAIMQQYGDANAASSSAMNQALAQSASDMSTQIGTQYGQYQQGEDQKIMQILQMLAPQLFQQSFSPLIDKQEGWGGGAMSLTGDLAKAAAMYAASSAAATAAGASERELKENIEPYEKGLETIKSMNVYEYDYKHDHLWYDKHRVGLMADEVPKESLVKINGINHVDFYAIIGLLVNAVKDLSKKVELLEAK